MLIGYARVSTQDQSLEMQIEALKKAGCEIIFQEKKSGASADRPEFQKCLAQLRKGDTLVFYKLDRLGRTVRQLVRLVEELNEKEIEMLSLTDNIDTKSAMGKFFTFLMALFAELERDLNRERTLSGLANARAKGRIGGRPPGLTKENRKKALSAFALNELNEMSVKEIAIQLGISVSSCYKYIAMIREERALQETHQNRKAKQRGVSKNTSKRKNTRK